MDPSDDSVRIKLTRRDGGVSWAVIDASDLPLVLPYRWHEARRYNTVYVETTAKEGGLRKNILMHRLLTAAPVGSHVDHQDGNGLNNRRSNIRVATSTENRRNEVALRLHTSPYRGASWSTRSKGWTARIGLGSGRHFHLGVYDTAIEAALAYDAAARKHFGQFASTNFTEDEASRLPAPKRRRKRKRDDLPHGRGRYTNYGCRCDVCRAAESTYQRARRDRDKAACAHEQAA